ncbi:MAG: branched-chain amino acid ABC transporter permease [Burkholderiales bacterium 70-64]|nr:MAG: branched-chain amino acid ABC transporter permease [Burkholderiales bacterium 70-64]
MDYYLSVATFAALNVVLALGLNMISGFCGQVSLGHAAFYGLGAYAAALCSVAGMPFVLSVLVGVVVAGAFGVVVGFAALRVRDDFLAIVTMGVGFLFLGVVRKQAWLGAEMGIARIPSPMGKGGYALMAIGAAIALVLLSLHVRRSWMGRAFDAVAQDEDAARTIGVDVAGYKTVAFLLGTASAGLAGAIYAHMTQLIVPDAFNFIQSITILAMVVVGGIGSTLGVVLGAVLLTVMPELFRFINDYKLLVYGALLLLVMRFSPEGFAGLYRRVTGRRLA